MSAGRFTVIFFSTLWLAMQSGGVAARVTAEVDRSEIAMGETLRLTLTADSGERPDTINTDALMRDFEILQRSSATSARVVGGEQSVTRTLEMELLPLREGIATIPAFDAGGRRTTPIAIKVNPEPDEQPEGELVYFDARVDKDEVYVQAQVILTITLQQAINLDNRAISELNLPDAYQEPLEQKNFQRRAAGRLWQVTELRYALFPQKSGVLEIPTMTFSGRELLPGRSLLGARLGRRVSIKSQPINVAVKPVPSEFPGDIWLPARSLEFSSSWSTAPDTLVVGDSTTRTLRILAEGLQGSQLPPMTSLGGNSSLSGLRFYPDQETIDQQEISGGLQGQRLQSEALVTSVPGTWGLPELVIPWWNTETDTLEYAKLPAETISVTAPGGIASGDPVADEPSRQPTQQASMDLRTWQITAGIGWALALLLGGLAWSWRSRRSLAGKTAGSAHPGGGAQDLVLLKKACHANDPKAAREAVLRWARGRNLGPSMASLEGVASQVGGDLARELRVLDQTLFARSTETPWQGAQLFKQVRTFVDRKPLATDELPELYQSQ